MGWLASVWKWLWENFSKIATMAGWAMTFAIPAWAASAVEALNVYAPLSWILAGFTGMALMAIAYSAIGVGAFWWTTARIRSVWAREHHTVNPLETVFRNQRINVADLVTPFNRVVANKTFLDCELIGPANIYISATHFQSMAMQANEFNPCEAVMLLNEADLHSAITFHDCVFTRCKFYGLTLFFREYAYVGANKLIHGITWITATPVDPPQPELIIDALEEDRP